MNLLGFLESNTLKYPDKDAIRANGKGYTFTDVKIMSEKAAGLFQARGIKKGDRISIMSHNTVSFIFAYYGALLAGCVVVPLNHKLMAPEVDYILENSGAKILLFDGALSGVAEKVSVNVLKMAMDSTASFCESFDTLIEESASFTPVAVSDDDMAQILYTSGTTGKPKGCMITHRSIALNGLYCALLTKIDEDDRVLIAMPIWHSSPINNWFVGAQVVGAGVVLLREYYPLHFLQTVQDEKCTLYFGAPISYIMPMQLPNFDTFDLSSMKVWIYGGGPVSVETAKMIQSKYKSENFMQVYGMTETGPTGMSLPPKDQLRKAGSFGRKGNPGTDIKVMKSPTEQAKPGETGEIWLRSDCMMTGYYKNPEATAEVFTEDGWYKSGDVARIDEDGYLYMVDRSTDMIVTGGENVYSKEVEDAISACPGVVEVAAIAVPHPNWGETVAAIVVTAQNANLDAKTINDFLSDRLAKYKIPKIYHFVKELPHTPSGKVMKYKLREAYGKQ